MTFSLPARLVLAWLAATLGVSRRLAALLEARGVFSFYGGSTASVEWKKLHAGSEAG